MGRGCQKRRLCGGAKLKVFLVLVGAVHSIPGAVDESYLKSPEVCRAEGSRGLGKIKCREGSAHLGTTVQLLRGRWAVRKQVSGFALPQPHFDLIANDRSGRLKRIGRLKGQKVNSFWVCWVHGATGPMLFSKAIF